MIKIVQITVFVSLIFGWSQGQRDRYDIRSQSDGYKKFVDIIIDCFFVGKDVELVELVCDNPYGNSSESNYTRDDCFLKLFGNESSTFSRSNVKQLKTSRCHKQKLDTSLVEMFPNVFYLDISYQRPLNLKCEIFDFRSLEKFNGTHNELDGIFPCRGIHVKEIDLSYNIIRSITVGSFEYMFNLSIINLRNNNIQTIAFMSFAQQAQLKHVDLRNNLLSILDMGIFINQRSTLAYVNLQNNRIRDVFGSSSTSRETFHITHFDLSKNLVTSRDTISDKILFELGPSLEYLNLSQNGIEHMINFEHQSLKTLDLSFNKLVIFNTTRTSKRLELLNLEGNYLMDLAGITYSTFPHLSYIGISKNELPCQYAMEFVQQWSNITTIGDPCNQRVKIIDDKYEKPDRSGLYWLAIAVCSFLLVLIGFSYWRFYHKRNNIEVGTTPQGNSSQNIENPDYQQFPEEKFRETNEVSTIEPIYYEIDPISLDVHAYDHLQFKPMPTTHMQNHYHTTTKRNSKRNILEGKT